MSAVSPLTGRPPPVSPGRPRGARTRLSDKLLNELAEKFEQHGAAAMDVVAKRMPEKFLALAFGILPRDVLIEVVEQRRPGGLDAAEWELMLRVLDLIKANVPADANASPSEVFGVIEEALRARYAKPVTDVRENNPNKE
jgi:hypothetical protein